MPSGVHHVTSIASLARRNLDFYTGTVGLRLVKKTVNFDDPGSCRVYYGDGAGHPGAILTFFPWEGKPRSSLRRSPRPGRASSAPNCPRAMG